MDGVTSQDYKVTYSLILSLMIDNSHMGDTGQFNTIDHNQAFKYTSKYVRLSKLYVYTRTPKPCLKGSFQ